MAKFIEDDFLLRNNTAKSLYSEVRDLPIFDYHCHLSPKDIFENKSFFNITQLWLDHDHYKWRVMRNAGIDEKFITGDAQPYEKFESFASVLPAYIANPVYHWAHLELKKYFGITIPICKDNAREIWDMTKNMMSDGSYSAQRLIENSNVDTVVTTDDPLDDLCYHEKLTGLPFSVLPCFRPDPVINIERADFIDYVKKLEDKTRMQIKDIASLLSALAQRLDYFIAHGAVAADCSFTDFPVAKGDEGIANEAFRKRLNGESLSDLQKDEYVFAVLKGLCSMFEKRGMVMQLHTGVIRNCNSVRFSALGADCGTDSVGNAVNVEAAANLFDCAEKEHGLPRTIVYTLNPSSYYPLATLLGDFAGKSAGKMQLGAAWWFIDHRDGIREQLKIFAATSGLGYFNGMLTDSRSFISYVRHDYFRRILCSVLGEWAEDGEYPCGKALSELAKNISYYNAKNYFEIKR